LVVTPLTIIFVLFNLGSNSASLNANKARNRSDWDEDKSWNGSYYDPQDTDTVRKRRRRRKKNDQIELN
jgi:hypothetical protein